MNIQSQHILSILLFSLFACSSTVSVTEHQTVTFNKSSTVTILHKDERLSHLKFELEHQLLARGYNIVSEDVALRKAKLDVDVDYNKNKVRGGTESYQVRELMSIYSLTLYGKVPIIYGSLINLRTGQIAKSIKIEAYSGSMSEFVEVLIDKMEGKPRRDARSDRRNLIIVGAFVGGTFLATLLLQIGK